MKTAVVASLAWALCTGWMLFGLSLDFERCPGKAYCWQKKEAP